LICRFGLIAAIAFTLGACSHQRAPGDAAAYGSEEQINTYPTNYKTDITAAMRAYLNDPSGIRDASISEPVLKPASPSMPERYIACLRFNAKKSTTVYAGVKEIAAIFLAGRFDQFVDAPKEEQGLCANAAYNPFPELEKLSRY
jgi:hypothetical protein